MSRCFRNMASSAEPFVGKGDAGGTKNQPPKDGCRTEDVQELQKGKSGFSKGKSKMDMLVMLKGKKGLKGKFKGKELDGKGKATAPAPADTAGHAGGSPPKSPAEVQDVKVPQPKSPAKGPQTKESTETQLCYAAFFVIQGIKFESDF